MPEFERVHPTMVRAASEPNDSTLAIHNIGAEIMGRNKFGPVRGPWEKLGRGERQWNDPDDLLDRFHREVVPQHDDRDQHHRVQHVHLVSGGRGRRRNSEGSRSLIRGCASCDAVTIVGGATAWRRLVIAW